MSNETRLSWVNLFTDDLERMLAFYTTLFGFEEIPEMRNPVFRGINAGAVNLGLMARDVYGILQLEQQRRDDGSRFLLNFDVASTDDVERLTGVAVELGATVVKEPSKTSYGWYQSVLLDPEGHVFRVNKVLDES